MAFPPQTPRAFTRENILQINPGQTGVYGLFDSTRWIYVGKGDIRTELLRYSNGENPLIARWRPTHWVDWVTSNADSVEKQLILELNPVANQKVG